MTGLLARVPWAEQAWWTAVLERSSRGGSDLLPGDGWTSYVPLADETFAPRVPGWQLWIPLAIGLLVTLVPALWLRVRVVVTLAHELGHAAAGMLVGRRFTGFVVRSDMSGHAVTVGNPRGAGLAWTTWAGYPAPALLAVGLVAAALGGWATLVLGVVALVCLICLVLVRSWATAGVTLVVGLTAGALWWWRSDQRSSTVLLVVAAVLLVGAWRHVFAVARGPRKSDPAELARLTSLPGWFWVGSHLVAVAAATVAIGWLVLHAAT